MTDKDIVFKILTNEELAVTAPGSYSYIGWEGRGAMAFYLFADNYHKAAETLYVKMVNSGNRNEILDGLVYPLIFTHRQFVELMLKGLYFEFSDETEENLKDFLNKTRHDLMRIWVYVKPLLSKGKKHVGSGVNLGAVEHYIKELNTYDPDSMAMRYPVNKRLAKMRGSMKLDFHLFHRRMQELYDALNQVRYDITTPAIINHTDKEISDFINAVNVHKPGFDRLLEILVPMAETEMQEFEAGITGRALFSTAIEDDSAFYPPERPDIEYIFYNGDDFLILVNTLFYCGRHISEHLVTLSKNRAERIKEFACLCLDEMERNAFAFGNTPRKSNINIHSKGPLTILDKLRRALDILY